MKLTGLTFSINFIRIIACIEDRQVINKSLTHINQQQALLAPVMAETSIRTFLQRTPDQRAYALT
jgi:hypothetical protein